MPIKDAARKAVRQTSKRRERNIALKDTMKTLTKKFSKSVIAKKIDEAKELLPKIAQAIDKAAKNNVIRKNKASRIKSRLARALNKAVAPAKAK